MYCLPIQKARLLVQDAYRLRIAESLNASLGEQVHLLEDQGLSQYRSFTNLLQISEEKYRYQKEITHHMESLAGSYREELGYYQKREKKARGKNKVLGGLVLILAGALIIK